MHLSDKIWRQDRVQGRQNSLTLGNNKYINHLIHGKYKQNISLVNPKIALFNFKPEMSDRRCVVHERTLNQSTPLVHAFLSDNLVRRVINIIICLSYMLVCTALQPQLTLSVEIYIKKEFWSPQTTKWIDLIRVVLQYTNGNVCYNFAETIFCNDASFIICNTWNLVRQCIQRLVEVFLSMGSLWQIDIYVN